MSGLAGFVQLDEHGLRHRRIGPGRRRPRPCMRVVAEIVGNRLEMLPDSLVRCEGQAMSRANWLNFDIRRWLTPGSAGRS